MIQVGRMNMRNLWVFIHRSYARTCGRPHHFLNLHRLLGCLEGVPKVAKIPGYESTGHRSPTDDNMMNCVSRKPKTGYRGIPSMASSRRMSRYPKDLQIMGSP